MKNIFRLLFVVFCLLTSMNPLHAQWTHSSGSFTNTTKCFTVNGTNIFAGTTDGVILSTNNGTNWTAVNTGLSNKYIEALAVIGTNVFAGTDGGGVYRSTNNGTSWTAVNTGLTNNRVFALAVSGTNLFAGTSGGGIFRSADNGANWTEVNSGLSSGAISDVLALAVSGTNLFAATYGGVFLTTNNGSSWTAVNTGLPKTDIRGIMVSGTNIFAGVFIDGVYISNNNGTSWTATNTGLPGMIPHALVSGGSTILFVGDANGGGVFLSKNNGTSWTAANTGLNNKFVEALAIIGTNIYAGTDGGVWKRPVSEMTTGVKDNHKQIPTRFALEQNYPNPFNPATTISFSLPSKSFVSLKVFDALGKEVSTLLFEELTAGTYTQQWNASGFVSGVYFYRLQAGSFTETRKLLLLR